MSERTSHSLPPTLPSPSSRCVAGPQGPRQAPKTGGEGSRSAFSSSPSPPIFSARGEAPCRTREGEGWGGGSSGATPVIRLPYKWRPRPHQWKLWRFLERSIGIGEPDGRPGNRAVAVWHRRAGKDSLAANFAAVSAHRRIGNYWHMLPTARQGRKVIWEGIDGQGRRLIDQAFPPQIRTGKSEEDMLLRFDLGSTWQVVGSDNFDSLVGANPVGVVFSEWALADPRAWDYIRPILAENGGWALFIYTPRGRNHGAQLFDMAGRAEGWFAQKLTVDDTKVIEPRVIEDERRSGMEEEMIRQEYYCSFEAALVGSYYGRLLETLENDGRVRDIAIDRTLPVITAWDLGIGDATSIWFAQQSGREIRLVDYYEASGVGLDHYVQVLRDKAAKGQYRYGETLVPHDVNQSELGTGRTRLEMLRAMGVGRLRVIKRLNIDDGINAARMILPRCWFERERCARGLEALRQYSKAWSEERRMFSERPAHDWTSHAADAFRYLAVGLRENSGWNPEMTAWNGEDMPDAEGLYHLRRMERGGPPVYRDRDGNWRVMEVITEEE